MHLPRLILLWAVGGCGIFPEDRHLPQLPELWFIHAHKLNVATAWQGWSVKQQKDQWKHGGAGPSMCVGVGGDIKATWEDKTKYRLSTHSGECIPCSNIPATSLAPYTQFRLSLGITLLLQVKHSRSDMHWKRNTAQSCLPSTGLATPTAPP